MNEIALQVNPVLGTINTNFEEIEKQLAEEMKQYEGIVFTEDSKAAARKTVAVLRKTKKDIEDSRKAVKAKWLEPYNEFEARVKQMTALVDKPIDYINEQVSAFEEKRIAERKTEIEQIYSEEIGDLSGFLPLYKIQDDKWLNASTSMKSIKADMVTAIANVRAGKQAIEAMQSDIVPDALRKFQATLDLAGTLAYINQYEAQKVEILKREEERKKQEEERRIRAEIERAKEEERRKIADEERIRREAEEAARVEVKEEITSVNEDAAAPLTMPESIKAVYTVVGTDAELQELEMAMNSLGLYFERKEV